MLPESSVRQLKKLRQETKGTDIGDLTSNDRLNAKVPNLQYIGNPVDRDIESYEEFTQKDSKLQTIAFKSKLVNKKIKENMKSNIKKFEDFDFAEGEEREDLLRHSDKYNQSIRNTYNDFDTEREDYLDDEVDDEDFADDNEDEFGELEFYEDELEDDDECPYCNGEGCEKCDLDESVKTFEAFSVPAAKKEEKQPEYTMLGKEKELKSNPNFGYAEVRAQEIKKITDFNVIDPITPKERTIGGSAGVFIDNDVVKGYVNRIDGKDVYVESLDNPLLIKKFSIKDVVKTKKEK
jgi:hypothetical protein